MGNCATKNTKKSVRKISHTFEVVKLPEFSYIHREENQILEITSSKIEKFRLNDHFQLKKDSIIAYVSENIICVIGGTKNNNKKSKCCFQVNVSTKIVSKMPKLPNVVNAAQALVSTDCIYLITTDSPSLIIYHSSSWSPADLQLDGSSAHLTQFSAYIQNSSIFLIGGKYTSGSFSHEIYSISLTSQKYTCQKLDTKFMFNILSPKCIALQQSVVVGTVVSDSNKTLHRFCIKEGDSSKWNVVDCIVPANPEDYPPFAIGSALIFMSYPFAIVNIKGTFVIFNIRFFETEISDLKYGEDDAPLHESFAEKSNITESYIIRARVLTPINGSFIETVSSSDSGFSSQSLYSYDFDDDRITYTEDKEPAKEEYKAQPSRFSVEKRNRGVEMDEDNLATAEILPEERKEKREEDDKKHVMSRPRKLSLLSLQKVHDIKVLVNYTQTKEFIIFLIEILKIKNFPKLPENWENFTLFEFEKLLLKIKYKLYPLDTFKTIVKALDIIFNTKKLSKSERECYLNILEIRSGQEFIDKLKAIPAIIFRVKMIVLRSKQTM